MIEEEAGKIVREFYWAAVKVGQQADRGRVSATAKRAEFRAAKKLMDELTGKRPRTEEEIETMLGLR